MTTAAAILLAVSTGLVLYVFIGYPALMAGLATIRPRRPHADAPRPRVSLVIAAYNEADYIARKLENTAELAYPRDLLEVIVAADGSTDGTEKIPPRFGASVLHRPDRRGKTEALLAAAAIATGDVLVFSDADNLYEPQTIDELVAPFADARVGVVTGQKVIRAGAGEAHQQSEGLYWRYESKLKEWESAVGSVTAVCGEALAVRREALVTPPAGTVNDDFALAMGAALAGWRVAYAPRAVSVERGAASVDEEAVRRSRIVAGRWQALAWFLPRLALRRPLFAWQLVSHKALRPLVPFALLGVLVGSVALVPATPWAWVLVGMQALFYAAAAKGAWDVRRDRRRMVWYLPYYFVRVNMAAVTGLRSWLRGRRNPDSLALWTKARRAGD